ncbi:MAG: DoxX family protein [Sphingomicrobium sp.]
MKTAAILIARLIFGFVFGMAAAFKFKFIGMDATAAEIAGAGFPYPLMLAWVAAFFELGLTIAFLTGLFFTEAAMVAIAYVLFLALSFHGPDRWGANPMEFGFFTDHFTFIAGLLFAAVHGPGNTLVLRRRRN